MGDKVDFKAELRIQLLAGDVVVAEVADPVLWQRVLASITSNSVPPDLSGPARQAAQDGARESASSPASSFAPAVDEIDKMARELGLERSQVEGALSPIREAPFLHLDLHSWEAFQRHTPPRGPGSVAAIVLAATTLCLWFRHAELGTPSQAHAQAVLGTINLRDQNASRGIRNCEWLQVRGNGIVINPARTSRAIAVVRSFCSGQPVAQAES